MLSPVGQLGVPAMMVTGAVAPLMLLVTVPHCALVGGNGVAVVACAAVVGGCVSDSRAGPSVTPG